MYRSCSRILRNVSLTKIENILPKRTFFSEKSSLVSPNFTPSSILPRRLPLSNQFTIVQLSKTSRNFATAPSESETKSEQTSEGGQEEQDKRTTELLAQLETMKEKLTSTEDKYRRQLAETENVRQRFMRQVDEAKSFGIQSFCKDMLEIADVLELATESVPKEELVKKDNAALKQLYDGLQMTQTQMGKIFAKHGLVAVRPLGEKFDPNIHEAVFQVPDADKEPQTIANVVKIGYLLKERLIRPAKVGVYISSS